MKIFISGVAGLLGSNVAKFLCQKQHEVVGVDNLIGGIETIHPNVEYHKHDILDVRAMRGLMKGCDVVFHAAALPYEGLSVFSPKLCVESIVAGTVSIASAAISNNVKDL